MSNPGKPKMTQGGARPGSGRKPRDIRPPAQKSWLPMSQAQVDMWRELGGGTWLRARLDDEILKEKQNILQK